MSEATGRRIATTAGAFTSVSAQQTSPRTIEVALRKIARPSTGRAAAVSLVEAWEAGDRVGALAVAEKDVVAKLFAEPFPEPAPVLQGCGTSGTDQIGSFEFGGFYRVLELDFGTF